MSLFDTAAFNEALFFPRADQSPTPAGARDLFVEVPGAKLHVRLFAAQAALPVVVFFHGNGEVVADADALAPKFEQAGARLAAVDYRGYGASTGTPRLRETLRDAEAVLDAVSAEVQQPVWVMGRSLGGHCAAALSQRNPPTLRGLIFESAAMELAGVVSRRGLSPRDITEADRRDFDPLLKAKQSRVPTLFLHGARDRTIDAREARAGHAALPGSQLVLIEGRGHSDLSFSTLYWQALRQFLTTKPGDGAAGSLGSRPQEGAGMSDATVQRLMPGKKVAPLVVETLANGPFAIPGAGLVHLQFRRYAGCPICNAHLRTFKLRHDELTKAGLTVLAFFSSSVDDLRPFQADLPFPTVPDLERRWYAQFGVMERSKLALAHPSALLAATRGVLTTKWKPQLNPAFDTLPADFLIAPDGEVVQLRYGAHPNDHWEVDDVLAMARQHHRRAKEFPHPANDPADR